MGICRSLFAFGARMLKYGAPSPTTAVAVDELRTGQWHVGRSWPGMFPFIELGCPCPKAPCGLAAPVAERECPEHFGAQTLRQAHPAGDCTQHRHKGWGKVSPLLRK